MKKETVKKHLGYLLKFGVPLAITVLLCRSLFTDVRPAEMWHIIVTQCDFWWIALALVISIFSHVFRAIQIGRASCRERV